MRLQLKWMGPIVASAVVMHGAGCNDEENTAAPGPDAADVSVVDTASSEDSTGDVGTDVAEPPEPEPWLTVVDTMGFAVADENGAVPGFDLDGRTSLEGEAESCGYGDFVDPEGRPGIDNRLATLVPLFELAGIGAAEGLIQGAIKDGGLIIMFQVDGVDDLVNDPEVTLMLRAGTGVPLLGTDGLLLAGQTFDLHPESPDSQAPVARITDGVLEAGPFTARLPVQVFGVSYVLTMHEARIRARWTDEGGLVDGVLGGAVPYAELLEVGRLAAMDDASVLPAIELIFGGALDMNPDAGGNCTRISGAFRFTAVSGFLF
jgi:hypothetical protein